MKRLTILAPLLICIGCNQAKQVPAPEKKAPQYFQVDRTTAGGVRGKVRFAGKAPPRRQISMEAEAACAALHKTAVVDETVKVSGDGSLANVFVYIKTGLEGKTFEPPGTAVVLDQHGCQFVPRIVPLRVGQTLAVKNSDPVSHNIHPMPRNNRDWNQQQPPASPDLRRHFARPELMIPVKCNIHAWMKTYIGVLDHPYFAVTGAKGEFTFDALPPGKYTVGAWHESLGEIIEDAEVGKGETVTLKFTFK